MKWWFALSSWKGWVFAAVLVISVGVVLGAVVDLQPQTQTTGGLLAIQEVLIGTPVTPPSADQVWHADDRIKQQRTYATNEPLALRVVSDESAERQFPLTARLLKEDGSLQSLSPGTITVNGGVGGYCCWLVETPGKYKLQIFAATQAPFVLPVTIVPARQNNSPLRFF